MSDYEKPVARVKARQRVDFDNYTGEVTFSDMIKARNQEAFTKADYIKFHKKFLEDMERITAQKNNDYTGTNQDPFANFSAVERLGISSTEQGFLTRMTDKLSRLTTYCQTGKLMVKDESVYDTLVDLANYSALLAGYLESKKEKK